MQGKSDGQCQWEVCSFHQTLCCLSLLPFPSPALLPQLGSLSDMHEDFGHRGEVTEQADIAMPFLALGSCACKPLSVTRRRKRQPAAYRQWESELKSALHVF